MFSGRELEKRTETGILCFKTVFCVQQVKHLLLQYRDMSLRHIQRRRCFDSLFPATSCICDLVQAIFSANLITGSANTKQAQAMHLFIL